MRRTGVFSLVGIVVICMCCIGLISSAPEVRSQSQPPRTKLTTDEKLDRILDRLDKIEKRLSQLEAPGKAALPAPRPRTALRAEATARTVATVLPFVPNKPKPRSSTYQDCASTGDARGDQDLNLLKNRIDEPDQWIEVDFDAVLGQAFPATVGRVNRSNWDEEELTAVKRFEGLPISIVCYFAWAKDEGPESCNCHIEDKSMYDIHTWLTKDPAEIQGNSPPDRSQAIVAEVTPRLKPQHASWTQATIRRLAKDGKKVRVSGWLMLDQEHPEQLKSTATRSATRGTLWELHPIMEIEVWENNQWVPLDELQTAANFVRRPAA